MGVEVLATDIAPGQVKDELEGNDTLLPEADSQSKAIQVPLLEEPIQFGMVDNSNGVTGEAKETNHVSDTTFPKDAAEEWPAQKQFHSFYFIKYRTYEDSKLKAKIEQADKEIQKKSQARFQITEALRAKRSERAQVISQLKPLTAEDKQYRTVMDGKRKEMEPLQVALGKLRTANNAAREKGMGICSSEEELNDLIESLNYRMQHESNTLVEEKQLIKEIKQLEGTREKVIANAAIRAKIQDSMGQKEAIQDQVKLIGGDLDGVRKEQQVVRMKIKNLEEELKDIEVEIASLQEKLNTASEEKDKAYENLAELRKVRDEANACFYQNRSLLNNAKNLAAKKDISAIEELSINEVENFMLQYSSNKAFRDDYERRILPSLDMRQLSRDGRMRNPDEKPILSAALPATEPEATPVKLSSKPPKEDVGTPLQRDITPAHKAKDEVMKPTEVLPKQKADVHRVEEDTHVVEISKNDISRSAEVDVTKLKEMKREEEIAKAKLAMERKKKLAEKAASKAAVRAQKEAEKKLKEKEKRARKKTGAAGPDADSPADEIEPDSKIAELEEAEVKLEAPGSAKSKEQKEKTIRHRNRPKGQELPKAILKRKKSQSYWLWAAPAGILAVVLALLAYYYL